MRFSFTEVKAGIKKAKLAPGTRVYISWGEREGKGRHALAQYTGKALEVTNLLTAGGATVYPYCQLDGRHCEADWRRQLGAALHFCSGGGKPWQSKTKAKRKSAPAPQARRPSRPNRARAGAAAPHG